MASKLSISQRPNSTETLTLEASRSAGATSREVTAEGSSATAQSPATASAAVWTQRRNGETKTRWIGKPRWWARRRRPVQNARLRPVSKSGGSHGRAAPASQSGSKLSSRSPCLITTTFWVRISEESIEEEEEEKEKEERENRIKDRDFFVMKERESDLLNLILDDDNANGIVISIIRN